MPFEDDIFNYKKLKNTKYVYYRCFPDAFWSGLSKLVASADYKCADLRGIVNRSRKLLNQGHTTKSKYDELKHQMQIVIDQLHEMSNQGDICKLMDCLEIMMKPDALSIQKVNEFLRSHKVGYYYSAEDNKWETIGKRNSDGVVRYKEEKNVASMKKPKIFISHAFKDKAYIKAFVEWLESIGLEADNIFCASVAQYGIPEGEDIYEFIEKQYKKYDLYVFFMLSKNYYKSPASLNEMGAAWILHKKYTTFLLPGFQFKKIAGAVNPEQIGIQMDADEYSLKDRFNKLRLRIKDEFNLAESTDARWEEHRDTCIAKMKEIYRTEQEKKRAVKR